MYSLHLSSCMHSFVRLYSLRLSVFASFVFMYALRFFLFFFCCFFFFFFFFFFCFFFFFFFVVLFFSFVCILLSVCIINYIFISLFSLFIHPVYDEMLFCV